MKTLGPIGKGMPAARICAIVCGVAIALVVATVASAQQQTVTGHVDIIRPAASKQSKSTAQKLNASDVAVWLVPVDRAADKVPPAGSGKRPQLVQKDKSFQPDLLIVRVGSVVDFPNRDPFFHNVFSLFDGKRFDLGLYEAGATNSVKFDHPGISFLFCNIHPEMSAVVIAVETPYFSVSDKAGDVSMANVPDGKYELHVWYQRSSAEDLKNLTSVVQISGDSHSLGTISVRQNPSFSTAHKNKYGQDYTPAPTTDYSHP